MSEGASELDYSSSKNGLNYPNPYTIQNKFLIIKIITLSISALILLVLAKFNLSDDNYHAMGIKIIFAFGFIAYTIKLALTLSKQLRVFFGRGQPADLVSNNNMVNSSKYVKNAHELRTNIIQGAIELPIPNGPFAGFIYSRYKKLLTAPMEIRFLMESLISNVVKMIIVLGCFLISALFALGTTAFGWLGLFFMIVTTAIFIQPMLGKEKIFNKKQKANNNIDNHNVSNIHLDLKVFWQLLAISIIFPIAIIIISKVTKETIPDISYLGFGIQSIIVILIAIVADVLNIFALKLQLQDYPNVSTSFAQDSITFNAMPQQLTEQIKRRLQTEWVEGIPNRVYASRKPDIDNGQNGTFSGFLMEETQPMVPKALEKNFTINDVKNNEKLSKILNAELFGLALHSISILAILIILSTFSINSGIELVKMSGWSLVFVVLLAISAYMLKITHQLWGRFDFESKIYMFELEGSFVRSKMNFGNQLKDSIQTQKEIISIENMTLRVYVAHLNTVVFGHGIDSNSNYRQITNMIGIKEEANNWLLHIKEFAEQQSLFVKTTSKEDFNRANNLSQLNALANVANLNSNNLLNNTQNKDENTAMLARIIESKEQESK